MASKNKLLEISPSPRLSRAKQVLKNQKPAPTLMDAIDEDSSKQTNVIKGEAGGPKGPDPTRYGDWERNGRCIDF